jgi:O-antigen/teichoic acid export membrane protein
MEREGTGADLYVVAKGGAIISVGIAFETLLRLPLGIVLARFLGPEQMGLYHITISTVFILSSLSLVGFGVGLVRFIPVYRTNHDLEGLSGVMRMGVCLPLLLAMVAGVLLFVTAPVAAEKIYQDPNLAPLLKIASFFLPAWALVTSGASVLRGYQKMFHFTLSNKICLSFIRSFLVMVLAITGYLNAETAIYSYGLAVLCTALLIFFWIWRQLWPGFAAVVPRYDVGNHVRFVLPLYAANLMLMIGPSLKLLLLGYLGTTTEVGIFGPITEMSSLASLVYTAISLSAAPKIAELHSQGNSVRLLEFYKISSKWIFALSFPLFFVLFLYSKPLLLLFGSQFLAGEQALQIMACAGLISVSLGMTSVHITMTGKPTVKVFNTVIMYVTMFGLDLLLVPRYGLEGAAMSALIAAVVVSALSLVQIRILCQVHPFSFQYLKIIAAGLLAGLFSLVGGKLFPIEGNFILLIFSIGIYLGIYGILITLFGLTTQDRHFVASFYLAFRNRFRS